MKKLAQEFVVLGNAEFANRNNIEAEAYYKKAAELNNGEAIYRLGELKLYWGCTEQAIWYFSEAAKLGNELAHYALGYYYHHLHSYKGY